MTGVEYFVKIHKQVGMSIRDLRLKLLMLSLTRYGAKYKQQQVVIDTGLNKSETSACNTAILFYLS